MKSWFLACLMLLLSSAPVWSQKDDAAIAAQMKHLIDSISASYQYQTGEISLLNGMAQFTPPAGFRYLNAEQSKQVLEDIWGNPPGQQTLGMIFPANLGPLDSASFAFNIQFDELGYVKDEDADKIDYTQLLNQMKESSDKENESRVKAGFDPIQMIGWASPPFYDKDKKILHWAKELKIGEFPENTLNYDVRILGRKGVLSLNAIGSMNQLESIKNAIPDISGAVAFTNGNHYSDFSKVSGDKIAAWTIGGLVAGKILAKAGLFAIILKFGKLILVALLAAAAGIWRFLGGRKKNEDTASNFETHHHTNPETLNPESPSSDNEAV